MHAPSPKPNPSPNPSQNWLERVTGFGTIRVEPLEWLALEYLCFNMRPDHAEEIYDNVMDDNPLGFAAMMHHLIARKGCAWVAFFNGRPAACLGTAENFPGCWQVFSFGTADYVRCLVGFKPKVDKMIGFARENGMHRLEAKSLVSHHEAHRFIKLIGMQSEGILKCYGRRRQDYIQFARTWD